MYTNGESVYTEKFDDKLGVFFEETRFPGIQKAIEEGDVSVMPGWGQEPDANYMIWFVANYGPFDPMNKAALQDANAGTFYSGLSNIDFRIEGYHPSAVCIRAHFAQHGFISHSNMELGTGLAAIYDVGNEMEDLAITGGKYGLLCRIQRWLSGAGIRIVGRLGICSKLRGSGGWLYG